MGFDIHGKNNDSYFRNNGFGWRPLWGYVCQVSDDILSKEDMDLGQYNNGHHIDEEKTQKLIARLEELLSSGHTQAYSRWHSRSLRNTPDETCEYCGGTGKQDGGHDKRVCNWCKGIGTIRPGSTHYTFDTKNVRYFLKFLKNTDGGFIIS